jgi:hypothetical protein
MDACALREGFIMEEDAYSYAYGEEASGKALFLSPCMQERRFLTLCRHKRALDSWRIRAA